MATVRLYTDTAGKYRAENGDELYALDYNPVTGGIPEHLTFCFDIDAGFVELATENELEDGKVLRTYRVTDCTELKWVEEDDC